MASLSTYLAAARMRDPPYRQLKIYSIKSSNFFNKHPHLHHGSFQNTSFGLQNAVKDERFVGFTTRENLEFPVRSTVDDKIGETHKCLLSDLRKGAVDAVDSYGGILEIKTATTSTMVTGLASFVLGLAVALVLTPDSFAVEEPNFSYSGHKGPDKWATLDPSFAMCANGKAQSPINIVKKTAVYNPKLEPLTRSYNDVNATLIDNIVNIQLLFGKGAGAINIDGKQYKLLQTHWHSPSEHTIDGIRYDVELHMVHQSADGSFAVIAVLYRFGSPDPLLTQLKGHLKKLRSEVKIGHLGSRFPVKLIRTADLESTDAYFRYIGSLTTPPCTENVTWTILEEVREMSKKQVASLRSVMNKENKRNARPTQPLNGRTVELYVEIE
ncbi:hypothetical protein MKW92_022510 [Papaver armeniacum]|nr:hypothetical protein MKW92_022510 [Papaver armeniacum]